MKPSLVSCLDFFHFKTYHDGVAGKDQVQGIRGAVWTKAECLADRPFGSDSTKLRAKLSHCCIARGNQKQIGC
eukprot:1154905-Pelagomonas_calceolata.AAC.2